MWHQSHDVALSVTNARDVVARAVRVSRISGLAVRIAIAKYDSSLALQFCERDIVTNVIPFRMRDRHAQDAARFHLVRERRVRVLKAYVHVITNEMKIAIANQRTRQKTGLAQYLKAVADSQHQVTFGREFFDRIHHRRETRQRARP